MRGALAALLMAGILAGSARGQESPYEYQLRLKRPVVFQDEDELPSPFEPGLDEESRREFGRMVGLGAAVGPFGLGARQLQRWMEEGRYEETLAELRRLSEDDRGRLVWLWRDEPGRQTSRSHDEQALVLARVSRLPPSVLQRYLQRAEPEAQQLLRQAEKSRSAAALRRLGRDYFPTPSAARALALLGDLAFEEGRFAEALAAWRPLAPAASDEAAGRDSRTLAHPGPIPDRARLQAKRILGLIFLNRLAEARREIDAYRAIAAQARGSLAGEDGPYVDALEVWWSRRPLFELDAVEPWTTLGGAPTRNRVPAAAPRDRLWIDGPAWRVALPASRKPPEQFWRSPTRPVSLPELPYYPIIADHHVVVSDGKTVTAYALDNGAVRFRYRPRANPMAAVLERPLEPARYSVSVDRGHVFARLRRPGAPPGTTASYSVLVALDLAGPDVPEDGRVLWEAEPWSFERRDAAFDSDPMAVNERVYATVGSLHEGRPQSHLVCYDRAGNELWQTKLAELAEGGRGPAPGRGRSDLVLWAESAVVVLSHDGFVVACDPWTGRRLWAIRYPRVDKAASPREPSAGLYADGRVFLAPADASFLFAVDADTGQVLWERPWTQAPTDITAGPPQVSSVVHLFGVVDGRLLFTDRYRLQALDAVTGAVVAWQQPILGRLPGLGRGLLAGAWILWPTADPALAWRTVTHRDGMLRRAGESPSLDPEYYDPTTLRELPPGNLALGQGCLAVAGPHELVVYVPAERLLPRLERERIETRNAPESLFKLALAQLDAHQARRAEATLRDLWSRVSFVDKPAWEALLHERRGEPAAAPRAVTSCSTSVETDHKPSPERLGELRPAWGPVPGFAVPVVQAPGSALARDVVLWQDGSLVSRDAATGAERWRQPWAGQSLQWLGRAGGAVIAGGPEGLGAFAEADGRPLWQFPRPLAWRWHLVDGRPQCVRRPGSLGDFHFADGCVVCSEAGGATYAIDWNTGRLCRNPGEPLVASRSFMGLDVTGPERPPWSTRASIGAEFEITGEAGGRVRGMARSRLLWQYEPDWPTSLTGAPPQVLAHGDVVLALVPRNQGAELVRLDAVTGRPRWQRPVHELDEDFDPRRASVDERALYGVQRGVAFARSLNVGELLWTQAVPSVPAPWRVRRWGDALLAWPESAAGLPALPDAGVPLAAPLTVAWGRRGLGVLPVLLYDADSGRLRQRLQLPHDRGPVLVHTQGPRLAVSMGGMVTVYAADSAQP